MQAILDISINEVNVHYLGHTKVIRQTFYLYDYFYYKK